VIMASPMITPQKNELQKLQKTVSISQGVLFSVLLVCSLVFLPSSYSNAGGVDSNTITSGSTSSSVIGSPTSSTVTNDDGSTTTTQTTPTVTTTTTTTVTQTAVPNIVNNPTFTNELGGGSSTGWSISTCPGGCAFSPSGGFKAGNGGTITQSYSQSDLFGNEINSTEQGQGLTFSFGAEVDNDQVGAGNRADTWSIKLEMFDSNNSSLGSTEIGSTVIFAPAIKTGTLEIESSNTPNSGVLTLYGNTALNGDWRYGPFFNDIFTTYTYNSIDSSTSSATTYGTLISTISCEILNTCAAPIDTQSEVIETVNVDVSDNISSKSLEVTVVASIDTEIESLEISEIAEIKNDTPDTTNTGSSLETDAVSESLDAEIEKEEEQPKTKKIKSMPYKESKISNVEPKQSGSSNSNAKSSTKLKGKKPSPKQKAAIKKKSMSKAGNKAVKKMGDKKYSDTNQVKTLVIMQVLGNNSNFFDTQIQLKDTPNFFSDKTIPDSSISDNNYTSYFLFGGSNNDHEALTESQYGR